MAEPTVHTFDLSGPVCYCGKVHAQPTHTITHLPPREWEMPIPGTPLASWSPIPMCSWPPAPALSPEWADRLWMLALEAELPTLVPSPKVRIRVVHGMPPGWLQLSYGAPRNRVFTRAAVAALNTEALLNAQIRRMAALKVLTDFELAADARENDLIFGGDPDRPALTESEARAKAAALLLRMEAAGEISFS